MIDLVAIHRGHVYRCMLTDHYKSKCGKCLYGVATPYRRQCKVCGARFQILDTTLERCQQAVEAWHLPGPSADFSLL